MHDEERPAAIVWLEPAAAPDSGQEEVVDGLPDSGYEREVKDFFESVGFEIGDGTPIFSIVGVQATFESVFQVRLKLIREGTRILSATTELGELELPVHVLPDSVARGIRVITFEEAPDFGPTGF
ncbi:MAG: hypothetical protein ABFS14_03330 [Gemmatimonadota bacterium]